MRLLIVTQSVDLDHPILAFFHRWIEEFAAQCESVVVIAQQAGRQSLPANVTIRSLGKESGAGRLTQLWRFYTYSWKLRNEHDVVFVHMIPLYVVLGGPLWRLLRKRIGLWYTHGSVPMSLRCANVFAHHIFTAATEGFNFYTKKLHVTGHGIDTTHFKPMSDTKKDIDLITVGRIAQSKNLLTLIDILAEVRKEHDVSLAIVGTAITTEEKAHEAKLRAHINTKNLTDHIHFIGRVSQVDLPQTLNRAKVFVTTAQNGSLDKAMLEAMACGLPVVSMAPGSASLPLGAHQTTTKDEFVAELNAVLKSGHITKPDYADFVQKNHSLHSLITSITESYV